MKLRGNLGILAYVLFLTLSLAASWALGADYKSDLVLDRRLPLYAPSQSTPLLSSDGKLLLTSTTDGWIRLFTTDLYFETCSFYTQSKILGSPTLLPNNHYVFGTSHGNLYFIDSRCKFINEINLNGPIQSTPHVTRDGNLLVGTSLVALGNKPDMENFFVLSTNGEILFKYKAEGAIQSEPKELSDGTLVFAATDGNVYFLTAKAEFIARYKIPGGKRLRNDLRSSPAVLPNDVVAVGARNGRVYFLKLDKEAKIVSESMPSFATLGKIDSTPLYLNKTKTLVIASTDGAFYFDQRKTLSVGAPISTNLTMFDEDHFLAGTLNGNVLLVDSKGQLSSQFNLGFNIQIRSGITKVNESTFAVAAFDNNLYIFKAVLK